ncbi:MBL fold metallo-hydrolase [Streptomyces sp. NPDC059578]|uniref:MBL fold metallo-hydrolase n=1 Tax=unclassified Streptomyces TaxID=2593676 RepID=UPI00365E78D2
MRTTRDIPWATEGWERIGPRTGRQRLPGWDCTVGLVAGERAALLVDAGSTLREGAELREQTERLLDGGHVTHLALTHPHFDHVLGAPAFPGATVYGAAGIGALLVAGREELRDDAVRYGVDPGEAAAAAGALRAPGVEVTGTLALDLGGVSVVLADVGPGHTGQDLVVVVAGEPLVVFCGDLVEESGEPQAGPDAHPAAWPGALDRVLALGGPSARYVPGHGSVVGSAFVTAQRDVLRTAAG